MIMINSPNIPSIIYPFNAPKLLSLCSLEISAPPKLFELLRSFGLLELLELL